MNQCILNLEGVNDRSAAQYYYGKRVAYIYKLKSGQKSKKFKVLVRPISDHLGEDQPIPRQQRPSARQVQEEHARKSHGLHSQSHALPSKELIEYPYLNIFISSVMET